MLVGPKSQCKLHSYLGLHRAHVLLLLVGTFRCLTADALQLASHHACHHPGLQVNKKSAKKAAKKAVKKEGEE